jgi:hypothetical protein
MSESNQDLDKLRETIFPMWRSSCLKSGLGEPSDENGLDVRGGDYAASYVGKWGLDCELTKSHVKIGQKYSSTPWDFLRRYITGDEKERARVTDLFREYAFAFKGQKQLVFSRGLKQMYSVAESTDEELADEHDDMAVLLGTLTTLDWRRVLKASTLKFDARYELLQRARFGGWDAVQEFLSQLPSVSLSEKLDAIHEHLSERFNTGSFVEQAYGV